MLSWASPVPGGMSMTMTSRAPQLTLLMKVSMVLITIGPRHTAALSSFATHTHVSLLRPWHSGTMQTYYQLCSSPSTVVKRPWARYMAVSDTFHLLAKWQTACRLRLASRQSMEDTFMRKPMDMHFTPKF